MSFTANASGSVAVANGPTISAPLTIVEPALLEVDEIFTVAIATDLIVSISNMTALRYFLIAFKDQSGTFKVESAAGVAVPMEDGGSVQLVGKSAGPTSAARIILKTLMAVPADALTKLVITPDAATPNLNVKVVAVWDPTP